MVKSRAGDPGTGPAGVESSGEKGLLTDETAALRTPVPIVSLRVALEQLRRGGEVSSRLPPAPCVGERGGYIVGTLFPERPVKTRLIRIGNSRGVRLPKPVIEQAGLGEDVQLEVQGSTVVIRALRSTRAGWAEAATHLAAAGEGLLDPVAPTAFDQEEWTW